MPCGRDGGADENVTPALSSSYEGRKPPTFGRRRNRMESTWAGIPTILVVDMAGVLLTFTKGNRQDNSRIQVRRAPYLKMSFSDPSIVRQMHLPSSQL
jgi:hypothetical protein